MPAIPALRRPRHEDSLKFDAKLGYVTKNKTKTKPESVWPLWVMALVATHSNQVRIIMLKIRAIFRSFAVINCLFEE